MKKFIFTFIAIAFFQQSHSQPANTDISTETYFGGEPYLAINPINNQNLVAAWMALKFSGTALRIAIKTRTTFDGGATWSAANFLPHFAATYGSADESMSFDKSGLLFLSYIDYRQLPDSGGIYVARSFNGGLTWDTPSPAFDMYDHATKRPIDRPWLVVDKSNTANAGTLYITTQSAPWILPPNRNYFKVSSDSGFTWSSIANVDGGTHLIGNVIAQPMAAPNITANGNFVAAYPSYVSSQNLLPAFYLATSADKGQNFSYSTIFASNVFPLDTNLKLGYRLVASPLDSNKMVFLLTNAANGDADILALHSNNAGQTWSSSVRVNDDAIANGKLQDMVWADYNEQGNLVVTWRDRRNSVANGFWNAGYDFYYAISPDNGQTFSANQKLSSQFIPFDSLTTLSGNDFMSCVYSGDTLYTTWGDTRNGTMNIYFAKTIASTNTGIGFSILEGEELPLFISPNPANNILNVRVNDKLIGNKIFVMDANGKKVTSVAATKNFSIDISNLASGLYFVHLKNHSQFTERFIKN